MGCAFGEDQRGRGECYRELTGKWQREFCGRSVSGWEVMEAGSCLARYIARELKINKSSCLNLFVRALKNKQKQNKTKNTTMILCGNLGWPYPGMVTAAAS